MVISIESLGVVSMTSLTLSFLDIAVNNVFAFESLYIDSLLGNEHIDRQALDIYFQYRAVFTSGYGLQSQITKRMQNIKL